MKNVMRFLLLACVLSASIIPLLAQNDISLVQTIDSGERKFGSTFQLDETHYLSFRGNSLRIYQIVNDQINVVTETVVKDHLIPASVINNNRVYALAEGDGVYVYQITQDYQIVLEYIIPLIPVNDAHHYSLYIFGTKMLVQSVHNSDYLNSGISYSLDTYDIVNELQPVHLSRYWLPNGDLLYGAVHVPSGYYLGTFYGFVYYSSDLISMEPPFQLPGTIPGNEGIETSFVHEGKLYFKTIDQNQSNLRRYTVNADHSLSLDWVQTMPGYFFGGIRFEPDRVVMLTTNIYDTSYAMIYEVNGETWQQTACQTIPIISFFFPISSGYLGFHTTSVTRCNSTFTDAQILYSSSYMQISGIIMNRYVVLDAYEEGMARFYDLQTGNWLDMISSFRLSQFTDRWNKTEIILGNGHSCHLISFDDNGIASSTIFSLNLGSTHYSSCESKWGNRILSLIAWNPICVFRLFDYDNGLVTPLNTWSIDYYGPGAEFYSPDHFYVVQLELDNEHLRFYRINPDYSIREVASLPISNPYRVYQGGSFIATSGTENHLIDISNPDMPILVSTVTLGGHPGKNISYNGNGLFLYTGIAAMAKAQVINTQGDLVTSFYAHLPWYVGENRFVMYNNIHFCIMEHPEIVGNEDEHQVPAVSCLGLPYPNPFRELCRIPVKMKESGEMKLSVFNLRGQKVTDIQNNHLTKGEYIIAWDGKDRNGRALANGIYVLRLHTREGIFTQRTVLLK